MDIILNFVVLPLATIIFSIVLQRLLNCPILVAATAFTIFLILTYTVFETDFLIFAILLAILAYITAFLTSIFCRIISRILNLEGRNSNCNCDDREDSCCSCNNNSRSSRTGNNWANCNCSSNCNNLNDSNNTNLLTISSRCVNGEDTQLLSIKSNGNGCENNYNCGNNSNNGESIVVNAEVVPARTGRSGNFRGCFRRGR